MKTKVSLQVAKNIHSLFDMTLLYVYQFISEIFHASCQNYESNCDWAPTELNAGLVNIQDWGGRYIQKHRFSVQFDVCEDEMNIIGAPTIQRSMVDDRNRSELNNVQGAYISNCPV